MALYKKTKRGFTLIELMIAMSIFIVFTGILINSYTAIVRSQHEANEYRILYTEARKVFDVISEDLRNSVVDYCMLPLTTGEDMYLVSKDAMTKSHIQYLPSDLKVRIAQEKLQKPGESVSFSNYLDLNSQEIEVKDFNIYVTPGLDPYDQDNFEFEHTRFHPKVTVYALFEKQAKAGEPLSLDFQTTISSRVYNQVTNCGL